jgi:hypothetical protein
VSAGAVLVVWRTLSSTAGNQLLVGLVDAPYPVYGVDIEGEMELAMRYGAMTSPLVSVFQDGQMVMKGAELTDEMRGVLEGSQ